uniref:Putative juvenile hormone acid o-methyltransferase-like protein n=1 Tax=Lutzomyia longipalpis TaxID=7200 RepID=A0A1B0CX51_LUTLO
MLGEFDCELYNKYNRMVYYHVEPYLLKYGSLLKWKPKETIVDVGCGTGSTTYDLIYPLIPRDYSQLICTDASEKMLYEAKKKFAGVPKVTFELFDITGRLKNSWIGAFDHVFSSFCLMWIADQEKAFSNIYQMLSPGGGCFLIITKIHAFKSTMYELLEKPKWKKFLPNPDDIYVMPYKNDPNPTETILQMMKKIGFVNVQVNVEESDFKFDSEEEFLGLFRSFPNPMDLMTEEEQQDYLDDAVEIAYANNLIGEANEDDVTGTILVVYGEK